MARPARPYDRGVNSGSSAPRSRFVDGSPRLHAVEWRAAGAQTLFIVHGANQHSRYWDPLVRLLEPYRVIALDQRGYGASEWGPPGEYDAAHYLADLERAIEQLVPSGRFALIGHSLGSLVSMRYAWAHPDRLWAASFIDMDPQPPAYQATRLRAAGERPPRQLETIEDARARVDRQTPGLEPHDLEMLMETTYERLEDGSYRQRMDRRTLAEFPQFDNRAVLTEVTTPALVIRGAESVVSSAAGAEASAAALPNGSLATVTGEHQLHVQEPANVAEVLLPFLDAHADR